MHGDNKYFDEFYNYILEDIEPSSKSKKAIFNIIRDLTGRRGLKHSFEKIDADTQEEIIDKWINLIDSTIY